MTRKHIMYDLLYKQTLIFIKNEILTEKNILDKSYYSHLSNKRDVTLTDFGKFHSAQNKNPPARLLISLQNLQYFLQNFQFS